MGFNWFQWVLPGFTGFYRVLLGFYWVKLDSHLKVEWRSNFHDEMTQIRSQTRSHSPNSVIYPRFFSIGFATAARPPPPPLPALLLWFSCDFYRR